MKRWIATLFILVAITVPAAALAAPATQGIGYTATAAAAAGCMAGPVAQVGKEPITGDAFLCADPDGVSAQVRVAHLTPGNVYTAWFAYLDKRASCAATPCADADFLGDDPVGAYARMDAVIADDTGKAKFVGDFPGFRLSNGSEVQLVIFVHGPASKDDNRQLARQLLTPQDPTFGAPAAGAKVDGIKGTGAVAAVFDIG